MTQLWRRVGPVSDGVMSGNDPARRLEAAIWRGGYESITRELGGQADSMGESSAQEGIMKQDNGRRLGFAKLVVLAAALAVPLTGLAGVSWAVAETAIAPEKKRAQKRRRSVTLRSVLATRSRSRSARPARSPKAGASIPSMLART